MLPMLVLVGLSVPFVSMDAVDMGVDAPEVAPWAEDLVPEADVTLDAPTGPVRIAAGAAGVEAKADITPAPGAMLPSAPSIPEDTGVRLGMGVVAATAPLWMSRLAPFIPGFLPMYSRLNKDDVVRQESRRKLLDLIQENPGMNLKELQRASGLGWGNTQYHVQRLEQAGMVLTKRQGHARRAYPAGEVSRQEIQAIGLLQNETARGISSIVWRQPGLTQSQIAEHLDCGVPLVNKWVKRLEEGGLLERERDGRKVLLRPGEGLETIKASA